MYIMISKLEALQILIKLITAYIKEAPFEEITFNGLITQFTNYCENISRNDIKNWHEQV